MTNKKYHTTLLFYLAAFFLPVLIMIGVLYSQKIYPGSERTILTSDGFHQYLLFLYCQPNGRCFLLYNTP